MQFVEWFHVQPRKVQDELLSKFVEAMRWVDLLEDPARQMAGCAVAELVQAKGLVFNHGLDIETYT